MNKLKAGEIKALAEVIKEELTIAIKEFAKGNNEIVDKAIKKDPAIILLNKLEEELLGRNIEQSYYTHSLQNKIKEAKAKEMSIKISINMPWNYLEKVKSSLIIKNFRNKEYESIDDLKNEVFSECLKDLTK